MRPYRRDENGKLFSEDVEDIVMRTVAEQRLEGIVLTDEEVAMLRKYVAGDVTKAQYDAWAEGRAS